MPDLIGQSIGQYHILERLGEGGMAIVYKALDTRLEREVALKIIRTEKLVPATMDKTLKRFEREAKALARLNHPHIVSVTDYGEQAGQPYLVMPYLPGGTLKKYLTGRPIPWKDAARLLAPIARALDYAHQQGIVHRDVKPSNILITQSGQPMLSDFGVAKILDVEETLDLTGTGVGIGTPDYMAPEQGFGHSIDARMDVYALGVVFYEMVTGRRPYQADTPLAIMLKKNTEPLPRPTQFAPSLPRAVENHLIKALARDPANRFQTMGEMAASLEAFAQGKLPEVKLPSEERTATVEIRPRKNWMIWLGAGLIGLLCLAALATGGLFAVRMLGSTPGSAPTESVATPPDVGPAPVASPTFTEVAAALPIISATPEPPTFTPTAGPGVERISSVDGMALVYVPEGEFPMGGNDRLGHAKPEHTVYLDAFWIDQTEVTNSMFAHFTSQSGYVGELEKQNKVYLYAGDLNWPELPGAGWRNPFGPGSSLNGRDNYPVIQVTWNDAVAYCQWAGRRLPTEAEWEKAARGPNGYLYPWGNTLPSSSQANYGNQVGDLVAVGSYLGNISPYGALDMAGNVYEWVADYYGYDYYASSPYSNPTGPSSGKYRVMHGGSWQMNADRLFTFERESSGPGYGNSNLGFRCATTNP